MTFGLGFRLSIEFQLQAFGDFGDLVIGNLVTVGGGLGVLRASEP